MAGDGQPADSSFGSEGDLFLDLGRQALRESETRLRLVQSAGGIGSFDWDMATGSIHRSPEYLALQGLSPSEPLDGEYTDLWRERLHPEDRARVEAWFAEDLVRTGPFEHEYRIIQPSTGQIVWVLARGRVEADETGAPIRLLCAQSDITGRKATEAALRESEERLRLAQDAAGFGSFDWNLRDGRSDLSERYLSILGFNHASEVTTEALIARAHPDDRPILATELRAIDDGVDVELSETRIVRPDGVVRWVQSNARTLFDDAGVAVRRTGVIQDVTERREAEEALRASEARFRAAVAAVSGVVWTNNAAGEMKGEQPGWGTLTGQTRQQYEGFGWTSAVHPDDAQATVDAWNAAVAARTTFVFEHRVRTADGAWRPFAIRAIPVLAPDASVQQWVGVHTDISEQRAAEAALRDLNATLERRVIERTEERNQIWQASPDLIGVFSYDGVLRQTNPAWTNVLGFAPGEIVGRNVDDLVLDADREPTNGALSQLNTGAQVRVENRYRHKNGGFRWIAWTAAPNALGIFALGRDITTEKEAAAELERTQEQLRQSQKMEAVGQLTGGIAHDFNNLLQGITGSLDLVRTRIAQGRLGDLERLLNGASASANRAAALTHRLLAFSRRQPLDPKPVRANQQVASMEDLLRRTLGERIDLELVLAGGLWVTLCDANQLENALLNLAINARDAMPDGGKLTVETCNAHLDNAYAASQRDVAPGQYVCLCVTDTGTGMSPEVAERAFDPFFTTKPAGQGTGLGLSMIYGFARQSEGYVKIYSEVGQGTTVKLYLPRYRGESVEDALPEVGPHHEAEDGETVLVIEDETVVRGLIVEVLHDLGYRALEAADGPSGLEVLRSAGRIDLLVTDIGLPGLNGRQVAEAARLERPGLKVLFMTGYAENAALAGGFLEPGMAMITKPFAMEQLVTRIRDIVEGT